MSGSSGVAILVTLALAVACGRTELRPLPRGTSDGARRTLDADLAGGPLDEGTATGGQDAGTVPTDTQRVRRITKIVAGSYTACALKADGTVKCWPSFEESATSLQFATQATDLAVIAGEQWPASPTPKNQVWNELCVAMQGSITCNNTPSLNRMMEGDVISLSVGIRQTCAVLRDGRVRCYGAASDLDSIRKATKVPSMGPMDVPGLSNAVMVSTGDRLVCAILKDKSTSCFGQLHDDVAIDAPLPQTMSVPPAVDLSAADDHYCVVTTTGEVVCRGCIYNGQGGGPSFSCGGTSADLAALGQRQARQVRTSYTHRCVRLDDGAVRCWGSNDFGELGFTSTGAIWPSRDVEGLADVVDIAVGVHFSCALTASDEVYCWGGTTTTIPPGKQSLRQITNL